MNQNLNIKRAIIIGGSSGIGLGLAKILCVNNFKVIVTGIEKDLPKLEGIEVKYLDSIKDSSSEILPELVNDLDGLDLLVFSAGIGNLNKDLGHKVENNANLLNVLAFTEIADWAYRFFDKQKHGHLVGITSISAIFGSRWAPAYHAAKAYQMTYLEGLRQKATKSKTPIHITDIRPGFVKTQMTEGKKVVWEASVEKASKQIYCAIKNKKSVAYVSKRWLLIATLIKVFPRWVRNRI